MSLSKECVINAAEEYVINAKNADICKKVCKICSTLHKDENRLLIHLLMFHFKVSTVYFPFIFVDIDLLFLQLNKNVVNIHYHWVLMHFVRHIVLQQLLLSGANYRTRAIITRGLYTFYPLSEVHLCTVTFGLCMVSIQERFLIESGL